MAVQKRRRGRGKLAWCGKTKEASEQGRVPRNPWLRRRWGKNLWAVYQRTITLPFSLHRRFKWSIGGHPR